MPLDRSRQGMGRRPASAAAPFLFAKLAEIRRASPSDAGSFAQTEMGAGIAASPHLHRAKDLPVFASLVAFAPRSSILAHQLRRRFRWWSSPKAGSVIFRGPSWVGPFRVACSQGEPRTATGRPTLPAPLPVVRLEPKLSSSPSGGDRSFRHLPHLLAVAGLPLRRGLPSRSPMQAALLFRVGEAKKASHCLWITGISCTTHRKRNECRSRLPIRSRRLTCGECPNPLPPPPNPPTCKG